MRTLLALALLAVPCYAQHAPGHCPNCPTGAPQAIPTTIQQTKFKVVPKTTYETVTRKVPKVTYEEVTEVVPRTSYEKVPYTVDVPAMIVPIVPELPPTRSVHPGHYCPPGCIPDPGYGRGYDPPPPGASRQLPADYYGPPPPTASAYSTGRDRINIQYGPFGRARKIELEGDPARRRDIELPRTTERTRLFLPGAGRDRRISIRD